MVIWTEITVTVEMVDDISLNDLEELAARVMSIIIDSNVRIPWKQSQAFITYSDNQPCTPPAPRGVPKTDVTFDILANGNLNVSALESSHGKEITNKNAKSKEC